MKISIIIPTYNEENNIPYVISSINNIIYKYDWDAEILVIDDGSTDQTSKMAQKYGAQVFVHKKNLGKGIAIKTGINVARNNILLFIDGDGQDDPSDIPKFINKIRLGADFVIGSRFIGSFEKGAISRLNYFLTSITNLAVNILFHSYITDSQAGFRCLRKDKILSFALFSKQYEIETEMLIKAIKKGLKIVEVPVTRFPRNEGRSKLNVIKQGFRIGTTLLRELIIK